MFCNNCGTEINSDAKFCMNCGSKVNISKPEAINQSNSKPRSATSVSADFQGINILSFLIPLVGLVLYVVYYSNKEFEKANGVGKWGLIGFGVGTLIYILFTPCAMSMY